MIKNLLIVVFLVLTVQPVLLGTEPPLTLSTARAAIDRWKQGAGLKGFLPFSLAGYSSDWELRSSSGLSVLIVSRNLGGTLLTFEENGNLRSIKEVHEIVSVSFFDFDGDTVSELITDEFDGRGTGVVIRRFHIYSITGTEIVELWTGTSYESKLETLAADEPSFLVTYGYLRYHPPGSGQFTSQLLHLTETFSRQEPPRMVRSAFSFKGGRFNASPWPESR